MKKNIIERNDKLTSDDLNVLRHLETEQKVSQRDLSNSLGISLGKVNFILRALIDKGIINAKNFKNNKRKINYIYLLTPSGIAYKTKLTVNYMKKLSKEYEALKKSGNPYRKDAEM